jgi:dienelactone hydrolase
MKDRILECLGIFPKKAKELNIEIVEEKQEKDYVRQLIAYNVEENERVQSYLLIPNNMTGKTPAILAIHQHAGKWHLGKSEVVGLQGDPMFAYGLDLVKKGFVVIAPDLLCFEDRINDTYKEDLESHSYYERFEFCKYIQYGSTLQTKYIHDLSVALDVLETLAYVDTDNIGAIGHSLGGQEAVWISWYDKRIKASVSSCGVSTIEAIIDANVLHNFALYVPRLNLFCDMDEVIKEIQPRAFMMISGLQDERHFPLKGITKIEETNRYNKNFKSITFDDSHKFNTSEKEIAYTWLNEILFTKNMEI